MQFLGPCELGAQEQYFNNGTVQKMQSSSQTLLLKGWDEKKKKAGRENNPLEAVFPVSFYP